MLLSGESDDFLGDLISQEGIRPNEDLAWSAVKIPAPKDKRDEKRMLSRVKYFSKYIPQMSQRTADLHNLFTDDAVFQWSEQHIKELKELKCLIRQAPVLALFDPHRGKKSPLMLLTMA